MTFHQKIERGQRLRERVAYLKLCLGLTLKEIADQLHIGPKAVDYYWQRVKAQIRSSGTT